MESSDSKPSDSKPSDSKPSDNKPSDKIGAAALIVSIIAIIASVGTARFVLQESNELTTRLFKANTIRSSFEVFQSVDSPISADQIKTARAMPERYFESEIFLQYYKEPSPDSDDPDRAIRRYLIVFRIYHYLLYFYEFHKDVPDFFGVDLKQWIPELWEIKEFNHVHQKWGVYYPRFSEFIESKRAVD